MENEVDRPCQRLLHAPLVDHLSRGLAATADQLHQVGIVGGAPFALGRLGDDGHRLPRTYLRHCQVQVVAVKTDVVSGVDNDAVARAALKEQPLGGRKHVAV